MKTTLMMTALLASLSLGGVAQAQDQAQGTDTSPVAGPHEGGHGRPDFATLDTDGDGGVTLEEMRDQAAARFAAADTNGDGGLSAEEIAAQQDQRRAERIARMIEARDTNGDGLLQADEMAPKGDRIARMFDRLDADGDGRVSAAEFAAMTDRMGRDHEGRGGHGHRDGKARSRG